MQEQGKKLGEEKELMEKQVIQIANYSYWNTNLKFYCIYMLLASTNVAN